jgi:hypothetical protein
LLYTYSLNWKPLWIDLKFFSLQNKVMNRVGWVVERSRSPPTGGRLGSRMGFIAVGFAWKELAVLTLRHR